MKDAVMALDGGGSNLRIIIVDAKTDEELFFKQIETGTNLSTVPDKEKALQNIKDLIIEGYLQIPKDYCLKGIGLSSAGTEIKKNKIQLQEAVEKAVKQLRSTSDRIKDYFPNIYITNDIEILLHSSDIALVSGTGVVAAVKYKDKQGKTQIYKFDGNGPHIGDKGSGFWIAKEVLTKVSEIENIGRYVNYRGKVKKVQQSYLKDLVLKKVLELNGITIDSTKKSLSSYFKTKEAPEYVSLVYDATQDFDRAKVGNLFSSIADKAAYAGDITANEILKMASLELFKNVEAAYEKGQFQKKEKCDLLLSGSVLVHSDITRYFLEELIEKECPNINIKVNQEKPVWSTVRYVEKKIEEKEELKKRENGLRDE